MDGVISLDESNIRDFLSDAGRAGFKYDKKKPVKFIQGMPFMSLFYPKLKTYVDLFLGQSDFQKSLLARAKKIRFHNESINIVAPEDLILAKLISGRERDVEDVRDIITEGLKKLDFKYLHNWAKKLSVDIFLKDELKSLGVR
jgi:hypothetical protein